MTRILSALAKTLTRRSVWKRAPLFALEISQVLTSRSAARSIRRMMNDWIVRTSDKENSECNKNESLHWPNLLEILTHGSQPPWRTMKSEHSGLAIFSGVIS